MEWILGAVALYFVLRPTKATGTTTAPAAPAPTEPPGPPPPLVTIPATKQGEIPIAIHASPGLGGDKLPPEWDPAVVGAVAARENVLRTYSLYGQILERRAALAAATAAGDPAAIVSPVATGPGQGVV